MLDDGLKRTRIKNTVIAAHFPTVFMVREHDGGDTLNQKLEELMLRVEKETTNIASRTGNIGGYHSEANFFSRKEPEVAALRDLVQQALDDYVPNFLAGNCHVPPTNLRMRRVDRVVATWFIVQISALLLVLWFLFFSGLRWWLRVLVLLGVAGAVGASVREVKFTGDMVPVGAELIVFETDGGGAVEAAPPAGGEPASRAVLTLSIPASTR